VGALGITGRRHPLSQWADIDSLETLLGFDEFNYLALFLRLPIGRGVLSITGSRAGSAPPGRTAGETPALSLAA
jgi:hypothetical protein